MAPAKPEPDSSLQLLRLALQVDDHVRNRYRKALAGAVDDTFLQPMRAAFRVGRDDDLVRAEGPERILDRLQRLSVADLALGLDADVAQLGEASGQPFLRRLARLVVVRGPVLQRSVQRRRDDKHLGQGPLAMPANLVS